MSKQFAENVCKVLLDKKAEDVVMIDVKEKSSVADYFVIASADTATQVKALTGYTREAIKKHFSRIPAGEENDLKNRWNLLDYQDVIVHVLHTEERKTYAIEKFWNHAFKIEENEWKEESKEYATYCE